MKNLYKKINNKKENLRSRFSLLRIPNYFQFTKSGFSLIELLIVVSIMTIITSVTLVSHSRFSGAVTLENLAYEIALTIRQAQFFGMNVREVSSGSGNFDAGYGVYFDRNNPTSFIFFVDLNNNKLYDGAGELVEIYNMTRGNQLRYLCVDGGCNDPSTSTVTDLYVVFRRPDPDAIIKTSNVLDCGALPAETCGLTKIFISSPNSDISDKIIFVSSTGQITITN